MDKSTKAVATFIKSKGISITAVSDATKIPYQNLWASLSEGKSAWGRSLRASEFLLVCSFLGKSPLDFLPDDRRDSA